MLFKIQTLLAKHGAWARDFPTQGIKAMAMWSPESGKGDMDKLDDETASIIDGCLQQLKDNHVEAYDALMGKYVYRMPMREYAEEFGLPTHVVRSLIKEGETFVWGGYEAKVAFNELLDEIARETE